MFKIVSRVSLNIKAYVKRIVFIIASQTNNVFHRFKL